MQKPWRKRINRALSLTIAIGIYGSVFAAYGDELDDQMDTSMLQLEVFINDVTTGMIGAFRYTDDGRLLVREKELREVGIKPAKEALGSDGWISLDRLQNVSHRYDEANQILYFETTDAHREPRQLNARDESDKDEDEKEKAQSSVGAYVNYRLYSSFNSEKILSAPEFQGASGTFDAVGFSPFGNINHSFLVRTNDGFGDPETVRLSTSWNYYDQNSMMSYRVGDMVTGGLQWTRPVYLGGVQIRRNFSLRPDLVTMPIPSFTGSAAVPSTLDVYTNGARSYSTSIPGGPFQINNLPIVSGAGTARIVVRDASGREVVQDVPFFTSSKLLSPGLIDFSLETGFARNYYGIFSDVYDSRLMGSATVRWGATDKLTLEGHAEGGGGLLNGGLGATFALGNGVISTAFAYSTMNGKSGYQIAGSYETQFKDWHFYLRSQRTFNDYQDIASVTATNPIFIDDYSLVGKNYTLPPRAIDQISVAFPVFDLGMFNLNFANVESSGGQNTRIASISHSRPAFGGTAYLSGYVDVAQSSNFGIFVGFSRSFDNKISASVSSSATNNGVNLVTELRRNEDGVPGSYGWRLVDSEGGNPYRGAGASYRGSHGRVEASVQQYDGTSMGSATVEGAVALAGGNVFLTNQINDAFAVVDVGAVDVEVTSNNRPIGKTGRSGKIIVPQLQSYTISNIAVDPLNLPVNSALSETSQRVMPSRQTGVVLDFSDKSNGHSALVGFVDQAGTPIPLGSLLTRPDGQEEETVGYDGQVFLENLKPRNQVEVTMPNGQVCQASFDFVPKAEQIVIEGVLCK